MKIIILTLVLFTNILYANSNHIKFNDEDTKVTGSYPKSWFKAETKTTKTGYLFTISKELNLKGFNTGMTVNVIKNTTKVSKVKPSVYAKYTTLKSMADDKNKIIGKHTSKNISKSISTRSVTLQKEMTVNNENGQFIVNYFYIANDVTDTLYIFIFGSPVESWDENKPIFEQIKLSLRIETEV